MKTETFTLEPTGLLVQFTLDDSTDQVLLAMTVQDRDDPGVSITIDLDPVDALRVGAEAAEFAGDRDALVGTSLTLAASGLTADFSVDHLDIGLGPVRILDMSFQNPNKPLVYGTFGMTTEEFGEFGRRLAIFVAPAAA